MSNGVMNFSKECSMRIAHLLCVVAGSVSIVLFGGYSSQVYANTITTVSQNPSQPTYTYPKPDAQGVRDVTERALQIYDEFCKENNINPKEEGSDYPYGYGSFDWDKLTSLQNTILSELNLGSVDSTDYGFVTFLPQGDGPTGAYLDRDFYRLYLIKKGTHIDLTRLAPDITNITFEKIEYLENKFGITDVENSSIQWNFMAENPKDYIVEYSYSENILDKYSVEGREGGLLDAEYYEQENIIGLCRVTIAAGDHGKLIYQKEYPYKLFNGEEYKFSKVSRPLFWLNEEQEKRFQEKFESYLRPFTSRTVGIQRSLQGWRGLGLKWSLPEVVPDEGYEFDHWELHLRGKQWEGLTQQQIEAKLATLDDLHEVCYDGQVIEAVFRKAEAKKHGDENAPVTMYRLYNPYTGEHLFTVDYREVETLTPLGWNYEGAIGKVALHGEKGGVYRLYNPYTGEHHFTMSEDEVKACVAQGWKNEGIKFFSASDPNVVLKGMISMYNPYEKAFYHHYTSDEQEITTMQNAGWKREDIKWYVM